MKIIYKILIGLIEACAQLNVCFFNNLYLFDELLNRPFRIYKNSS